MTKIIENNHYFSTTSTTLATPQKFNAVYDAINTYALGKHNYIPPISISQPSPYIYVNQNNLAEASPGILVFQDTTVYPTDYTVSRAWTVEVGGAASGTQPFTGVSSGTDNVTFTVTADGSISLEMDSSLQVKLVATYTNSTTGDTGTLTGYSGIGFTDRGQAGADAISGVEAIISIPSQHQPLSTPGGSAEFKAMSKSLAAPNITLAYTWSLADENSNDLSSSSIYSDAAYSTASTISSNAYIKIDNAANKKYTLTLTVEDSSNSSTISTTTVELWGYNYGTYFYSYNEDELVVAPDSVTLTGAASTTADFFIPQPFGDMTVKWGLDLSDMGSSIACAVGADNAGGGNAVISAVLSDMSITAAASEYSIVRMSADIGDGSDVINKYLWTSNMNTGAKIISKLSSANINAMLNVSGYAAAFGAVNSVSTDHLYLVQGVVAPWSPADATIGPNAERYYIALKHTDGSGNYLGKHDKHITLTQSGNAAPISTTFSNVPLDTHFKAEVISSNGGAYSNTIESAEVEVTGSAPHTINSVTTDGGSSGATLTINLNSDGTDPVGYLVSYKEVALTSNTAEVSPSFNASSTEWTVFYTNTQKPKLVGSIGRKIVGGVQAVGADGSKSATVTFEPISIQVETSLDMSGLSKHLGRSSLTVPSLADLDDSYPSDLSSQKQFNIFSTVFGRDVFIEQLNSWVHSSFNNTSDVNAITIQIQIEDQDDHKEVAYTSSERGFKSDTDLSIPVPAGKTVVVCLVDTEAPTSGSGNIVGGTVDITCELFYAHASNTLLGSSTVVNNSAA